MNRLQSVSWDTTGFGDTANPILPAATVTYSYRTKSSTADLKDMTQLAGVTAANVSIESYSYDIEGRVSSKTLTLTSALREALRRPCSRTATPMSKLYRTVELFHSPSVMVVG